MILANVGPREFLEGGHRDPATLLFTGDGFVGTGESWAYIADSESLSAAWQGAPSAEPLLMLLPREIAVWPSWGERRLRGFAAAAGRAVWELLADSPASRRAVEAAEAYGAGRIGRSELATYADDAKALVNFLSLPDLDRLSVLESSKRGGMCSDEGWRSTAAACALSFARCLAWQSCSFEHFWTGTGTHHAAMAATRSRVSASAWDCLASGGSVDDVKSTIIQANAEEADRFRTLFTNPYAD